MPIYEYECQKCGHYLEKLQKISDSPLVQCPKCEQDGLKKLVSAVAFQLKGTGWYATDFKDQADNAPKETNKNDNQKSTSTDKPANKPADKPKADKQSQANT